MGIFMGFKDFYFNLEEKFHHSVDVIDTHVPIRWFTDAIDKVIPSFIFVNVLILALVIFLVVFFAIPHTQNVNFIFKSQNIQLIDSFAFTFNVDGTEYTGNIEKGLASVIVDKGDTITLESLSTKEYKINQNLYDFSETLTINLDKVIGIVSVSLFLFNEDGSTLTKKANLVLSCSSDTIAKEESQKIVDNGTATVNVPETCGTLNINGQVDGFTLKSGQICDSSACSIEFGPVTQVNSNNNLDLPNGAIKVMIFDELGNPVNGARVKIFDVYNTRDEIDLATTNALGITKIFSNLPVGKYNVYVSYSGYKDAQSEISVTDNAVTDVKLNMSKVSLGTVNMELKSSVNNSYVSGSLALKDSTGKIIFRYTTSTGSLDLPVYSYGKYLLDFKPDDGNLFPIGNYSLDLESTTKDILVLVKPVTKYDSAKINIHVNDEDGNPVQGVKLFVRDGITNYDLVSYYLSDTDSNGYSSRILPKGVYNFRAYTGFAEAVSESITVLSNNSGDIPEINVSISLPFGYSMLNLKVKDEYGDSLPSAKVTFYKKPLTEDGVILTDVQGNASHSFRAGVPLYYKVEADNYQTYYSESRLLMNNYIWDDNVSMEPIKPDAIPRIEFLGLYDTIGGKETKAMSIGGTYYLGFRFHVYNVPEEKIEFRISAGNGNETVEKEKLFFIDSFTSANYDSRFSDEKEELSTLGDTKVFKSLWNNPENGNYIVYYKVQVRNNSSVKLYDPLTIKWQLTIDDLAPIGEQKEFLAGSKTICAQDSFCGRYTLLNKTTQLYVDSLEQDKFVLSPGNEYELNFDLINGIDGSIGELKNGILQIYNALSSDESLETVKNNISTRSFIEISHYKLSGPGDEKKESNEKLFGVVVDNYTFTDLIKNRYVSGIMNFKPVYSENSFLNFVIIDSDKHLVVQGKPGLSLNINAISEKKLNIVLFPDRILAPNVSQQLRVFVKDDSNSNIKDAFVSVRIKKHTEDKYSVLWYCKDLPTNPEGYIDCSLQSEDLVAGTYLQVIVLKDGYAGYSQSNLTPDLQVSTKLFEFDKDTLAANLIYPVQPEAFDSVVVTNNSASNITIDHIELQISNYNQDTQNFLNVNEMKNYIENTFKNNVILGRQLNFDYDDVLAGEAKTNLEKVFKAALNEQLGSEIDTSESVSGALKFYFKTDKELIPRTLPFSVKVTSDGFPTNAGEGCLKLGFVDNKNSFVSDGGKIINIPLTIQNQCIIQRTTEQGNNVNLPVTFDNAYIVLNHDSGALGLGSYSFSLGQGEFTNLRFSVPEVFATAWQQNDSEILSNINFVPRGAMGKENLTLKIIGQVKTSEGIKKVESDELKFNVSVMKIDDCIKVFDDKGQELGNDNTLTLEPKEYAVDTTTVNPTQEASKFELTIKNICEGLPLSVRICRDNNGNTPKSCGEIFNGSNATDYIGFKFGGTGDDRSYNTDSLIGEQKLTITRPSVSGAYALEFYAKQTTGDTSYKRIKFLPVNVQTTFNNYLFVDKAFLLTNPQDGSETLRFSDSAKVFNTDVPGDAKLTNPTVFEKLLKSDCEDAICLADLVTMIGKGTGGVTNNGFDFVASGKGWTTGLLQGVGVAATGVGITYMLVAAGAISVAGPAGWVLGIGIGIAALGTWIVTSFQTTINDYQERRFVLINQDYYPTFTAEYNLIKNNGDDPNYYDLFKITGQDKYQFVVIGESIKGFVGCEGAFCGGSKYWTDRIKFDLTCPVDYEIDSKYPFKYLSSGETEFTNYNDCWWDKDPTINGNTVTFYPKCGGSSFTTIGLQTYVILPCRLKSELWGRTTQGGIQGGYPNAGMFYVNFKDIDFAKFYNQVETGSNEQPTTCVDGTEGCNVTFDGHDYTGTSCDAEWCFKTYPVKVEGGIFDNINSAIRFAFKNPKPQELTISQAGQPCSNVSGDVIGFTGIDAKPKIEFNWNPKDIDINYCVPDALGNVQRYCDATQFFTANLKHIEKAQSDLLNLGTPECKQNPKILSPSFSADENTDPKYFDEVAISQDPDTNDLYLQVKKDLGVLTGSELMNLNYKLDIVDQANNSFDSVKLDTAEIALDIYRVGLLGKEKVGHYDNNYPEGVTELFNKTITMRVSKCYSNECTNSDPIQIHYEGRVWSKEAGCMINNPSTSVMANGKMEMIMFYDNKDTELFQIQDTLHYKAYLMQDGYTDDFLNDFSNSINNGFLPDLPGLIPKVNLEKLISETRIKIVNDFAQPKTNGAGLYEVHVNIYYPFNSLNLDDANILITLNKIKSATNDNIFYYMPIDGMVGIDGTTIDRQGYGVDFSGDIITIDDFAVNQTQLRTDYSTNSSPISHMNISTTGLFSQMNGQNRGTIFNANRSDVTGNIDVLFVPNLQYWKLDYTMENRYAELDTGFEYTLNYNDEQQYSDNVILPWLANTDAASNSDFTGQLLIDTYPRTSMLVPEDSSVARLDYDAINVTNKEKYDIFAYVFGKQGAKLDPIITKAENLIHDSFDTKGPYPLTYQIKTVSDIMNGIQNNVLCISKSSNNYNTRVFVNDKNLLGNQ